MMTVVTVRRGLGCTWPPLLTSIMSLGTLPPWSAVVSVALYEHIHAMYERFNVYV